MQHSSPENDTNSIKDSTKEILKKEKLIDPGNEHHHKQVEDNNPAKTEEQQKKQDEDADVIKEKKTGEIKTEDFDTSGEDG